MFVVSDHVTHASPFGSAAWSSATYNMIDCREWKGSMALSTCQLVGRAQGCFISA